MQRVLGVAGLACLLAGAFVGQALCVDKVDNGADIDIWIQINPHTLIIDGPGTWVTVQTDISCGTVNTGSVYLGPVAVAWTKANSRGNLVAKFRQKDIEAIVSAPSATLTLTGAKKDGQTFSGTDTIQVKMDQGK